MPLLGQRFVVDLDDAIFHSYDHHPNPLVRTMLGRKIDVVFDCATTVVVGNQYLAERARQTGARRIVLVPTTVDHRAYAEHKPTAHDKLTVGWIGSSATAQYLQYDHASVGEALYKSVRLHLIGVDRHNFKCDDVVLSPWSEATELAQLALCDIGLAPLSDGHWERGKCGLKAIQYMAMGIPVLAANVGALPNIVRHGETGFVYRDGVEFARYADQLVGDPDLRRRMGEAGRKRVAECYSTESWAKTIGDVLVEAASH